MTEPMSEERLAEIRSVQIGCWYSGEWRVKHPHGNTGPAQVVHVGRFGDTVLAELPDFAADIAVFFADAHEAVPELLGEVERLRTELAKYVGHEPTIAEEMKYLGDELDRIKAERERAVELIEPSPEAFTGQLSQNLGAALALLRSDGAS